MNAITEEERQRRRAAFEFARGSVRFEGIVIGAEAQVLAERHINGEITMDEFIRLGLALCQRERESAAVNPDEKVATFA